jgi:hypothetical protein
VQLFLKHFRYESMVKQSILILTFLITSHLVIAQSLFIQEGTKWKEVSCSHWANIVGRYYVENLRIEGDTTFNGVQYKKLYKRFDEFKYAYLTSQSSDSLISSTDAFFGGIREDSQKVYIASTFYDVSMDEKLIFDFSAQVNDTVEIWYETMGYYPVIVDSVYSVTVADGSSRNKFLLKEYPSGNPLPIFWIEGIGSNFGFLSSHYVYISDVSKSLRCVKSDNVIVYDFEPNSYFYCSAFPMQDCEITSANVDEINETINATIWPNPMSEYATLKFDNFSNALYSVAIYNTNGMRMRAIPSVTNGEVILDKGNLSSGLYFVRLSSMDQTAFIGKLVVE